MNKEKNKQKTGKAGQVMSFLLYALLGGVCGFMSMWLTEGMSFGRMMLTLCALVVWLYVCILLHMALHEAGHWLFGVLTGYRFMSYRVGSLMWVRGEDGRVRFRRFSLAGTGGQCLLGPPDWREDGFPCVLYNLGGCAVNLLLSLAAGTPALAVGLRTAPGIALAVFAMTGLVLGAINGLPLRIGPVENDGRNALAVARDRDARRAFWQQMKMAELQARGLRLRDMPEELFEALPADRLRGSLTSAVAAAACSRALDAGDAEGAAAMIEALLSSGAAALGLYRSFLTGDLIFCCLVMGRREKAAALRTKEQKRFMKAMKSNPSVLRTEYALALLLDGDEAAADKARAGFEKAAGTYPYPAEIAGERELLALADAASKKI